MEEVVFLDALISLLLVDFLHQLLLSTPLFIEDEVRDVLYL